MQNQHVKRIDLVGWGGGMAAASGILYRGHFLLTDMENGLLMATAVLYLSDRANSDQELRAGFNRLPAAPECQRPLAGQLMEAK